MDNIDFVKKTIEKKYAILAESQDKAKKTSIENVKKYIEEKYKKIARRDSYSEYIPTDDIREIFLPYITDPESFLKLTDEEIQDFYVEWYDKYIVKMKKVATEMDQPDIE